uniref:Uncharacterized protein n=1 Tax=Tetraselmis chuii TaxID=63592 RepID=A0A7S1X9U4_9CHLO|mmetsp:Transcript_43077/g.77250  ORF Transcript_43077/g.77250 Transcript_43077/m.77250 type:complete len:121 (+) Transcript_43077:305-667(+)
MSGRSGGGVERTAQKWRKYIRKRLHTNDDDILDLQLENRAVGNVPYFIALDYRKQCIIVSIRGSSTIQDAFTDMITTAAPLATLLAGDHCQGHHQPCQLQVLTHVHYYISSRYSRSSGGC